MPFWIRTREVVSETAGLRRGGSDAVLGRILEVIMMKSKGPREAGSSGLRTTCGL